MVTPRSLEHPCQKVVSLLCKVNAGLPDNPTVSNPDGGGLVPLAQFALFGGGREGIDPLSLH
jgi:hypothetical protein